MQAAVELNEASTGSAPAPAAAQESGFEHERVAAHLDGGCGGSGCRGGRSRSVPRDRRAAARAGR